ncbi:hypothetical protein KR038_000201 [Drosophila bunnanda]|nr:hypothetical protein KR038_000201 [Drosophila bunnanda]
MTTSLIVILANEGTQLMSLLDGSFLANGNWTAASPLSKLKDTNTSLKVVHEKSDLGILHKTKAEEEEMRRVQALWDPVLNQSHEFSMLEDFGNDKQTRQKVIKQTRFKNLLANGKYLNNFEEKPRFRSNSLCQNCDKITTTATEDINCTFPNLNIRCYEAGRSNIKKSRTQLERIKKYQRRSAEYPLEVHIFLTRRPLFGKLYSIFATMPALGNEKFVLNLTVDTKDYFIDEVVTKPGAHPKEWQYTNNLARTLRMRGLIPKQLPYTSCYFYRTRASFFKSDHKYVIARISSFSDRSKLLATEVHWKIAVRKPPEAACMPIFSFRFCDDPDYPLAYWSKSHILFMAFVTGDCGNIRYGQTRWDFYDLREKIRLKHVGVTDHFVLRLPPYSVFKSGVLLVLRACVIINDVPTVARCYLRYTPPKVDVRIVGNEWRKVDVRRKIILDGSQTRDLASAIETLDSQKFVWSCRSKDDRRNRYCRSNMSDNPVIRLPENVLRIGSQYMFTLTVSQRKDPHLIQTASQLLLGVSTNTITVNIRCLGNCAYGVYSPDESVQLKAECQDCSQPIVRYEWWVRTSENDSEETLLSKTKVAVFHYEYETLSIRLKVELKSNLSAEAFYTLRRNEGPNGSCTVSPSSGIEAVTTFEINCRGFETAYGPLYYRYVIPSIGIIAQSQYARYETYLTETEEIAVFICDAIDKCTTRFLGVDVRPFQFKNPKAKPKQRIKAILRNVKDLVKRGFWDNAISQSLAAVPHTKRANDASIIYDSLTEQEAFSVPQLERLAMLATQFVNYLIPLDYEDVRLVGRIFKQMSRIFAVVVSQREEVKPEAYRTLTAMHIYFMSILGMPSETHSVPMCMPNHAGCLHLERVRLAQLNSEFDPLILVKINQWMMTSWYLYKCIYFLGILGGRHQNPYEEAFSARQGGISYQMNMTRENDLIVRTIDNSHLLKVSTELLHEIRKKLNHEDVLFQIISQRSHHNLFWWYPYPMPAETNVLIVHAHSPNRFFWLDNKSRLDNPVVYRTDITRFSQSEKYNALTSSATIVHRSEVHYYDLMLDTKAMLAVRIVNCSGPIHVNVRLHRRPTSGELVNNSCLVTPAMRGKRVWLANWCDRSDAFVSICRQGDYNENARRAMPMEKQELLPVKFYLLLEIHQCSHFKNRSEGPGWSADNCNTTFEHSYGTSVHCICHTLGPLATRIFPIITRHDVEFLRPLVLSTEWWLFFILFMLLLLLLLVVLWTYISSNVSVGKMLLTFVECEGRRLKWDPHREIKEEILLVIVTGGQEFAGTTSNINIYLKSPRQPQSMFQVIQDPGHPRLLRNTTNKMQVPRGNITIPTRLALGIERNGRYPSWYCRTITVIDLELKRHQLFVVERWIVQGQTQLMRSKYFTRGGQQFIPQYTWWKRFRNRFEQLSISWYCENPITGPWQTSVGGWTFSLIERTAVLISKVAITVTLVSVFYGRNTVESAEKEKLSFGSLYIHWDQLFGLSFFSFLCVCAVHLFFEYFVMRWLSVRF